MEINQSGVPDLKIFRTGFGGKRELWGVALAFKEHGVEILASEPTLDAILLASRGDTVLRNGVR